MTDKATFQKRGRNARQTGVGFERAWAKDFHAATGIRLARQLRETREANIADHDLHPRVPCVFQCKKRKGVIVINGIHEAEAAALTLGVVETHYPVLVAEVRMGAGTKNVRGVGMYLDDWLEVLETFLADPSGGTPAWVAERRSAKMHPRVWDGLEQAKWMARAMYGAAPCVPVGIGVVTAPGGRNVALVDYDGWLRVVGDLYRRRLW